MEPRKQYDPHWPFPQYDENGQQLLPPGWNPDKFTPPPKFDPFDPAEGYQEAPF
jgi:hypothetical protein